MNEKRQFASGKARAIYEQIRRVGTVSKVDLLEHSGLTGSTLTRILDEMTEKSLIIEAGFGESTGGRKPMLYRINPHYAYAFGLEISRITSRLVLSDLEYRQWDMRSFPMDSDMTPEALARNVAEAAHEMLTACDLTWDLVLGLGIGAVGPVDRSRGIIVKPLHFPAPGWENVDICRLIKDKLKIPVCLDNGANMGLIGEFHADSAQAFRHMLYLHAGVGLRSAMMSGGKLVYGAVDMEGAVGQMIVQADGLPHTNVGGNYGALESYASIPALETKLRSALRRGRQSVIIQWINTPEEGMFVHLLQALEMGDSLAVELLTDAATYFGIGLANLLNILHPEKVILGGPLLSGNDLFFRVSTRIAVEHAYYFPEYQVVFSRGKLGEHAVASGAAAQAIMNVMEE